MSLRPLAGEVKAMVELLEQDWETPEALAEELIKALDKARASRRTWIAVLQFGTEPGKCWYAGYGPYAGRKSAERAVKGHPGASQASRVALVPMTSDEGLEALLRDVG